jgi:hypothetical protein
MGPTAAEVAVSGQAVSQNINQQIITTRQGHSMHNQPAFSQNHNSPIIQNQSPISLNASTNQIGQSSHIPSFNIDSLPNKNHIGQLPIFNAPNNTTIHPFYIPFTTNLITTLISHQTKTENNDSQSLPTFTSQLSKLDPPRIQPTSHKHTRGSTKSALSTRPRKITQPESRPAPTRQKIQTFRPGKNSYSEPETDNAKPW